jgi:hypothetical protein
MASISVAEMFRIFMKNRTRWLEFGDCAAECNLNGDVCIGGGDPVKFTDKFYLLISLQSIPITEPPKGRREPWYIRLTAKKSVESPKNKWSYETDGGMVRVPSKGLIGDDLGTAEFLSMILLTPANLFGPFADIDEPAFKAFFSPSSIKAEEESFECKDKNNRKYRFQKGHLAVIDWEVDKGTRRFVLRYSDYTSHGKKIIPHQLEMDASIGDRQIKMQFVLSDVSIKVKK